MKQLRDLGNNHIESSVKIQLLSDPFAYFIEGSELLYSLLKVLVLFHQLLLKILLFLFHPVEVQVSLHYLWKPFQISDSFDHIIKCTQLHRFNSNLFRSSPCKNNNGNILPFFHNISQHLNTIYIRHHIVQNGQIIMVFHDLFHPLPASVCCIYIITERRQGITGHFSCLKAVIHDQYPFTCHSNRINLVLLFSCRGEFGSKNI